VYVVTVCLSLFAVTQQLLLQIDRKTFIVEKRRVIIDLYR
jgi:hypothetical protein